MVGIAFLILMFLFAGTSGDSHDRVPYGSALEDWQIQTLFFLFGLVVLMCFFALMLMSIIILPVVLEMKLHRCGKTRPSACFDVGAATLRISKIQDLKKEAKSAKVEDSKKKPGNLKLEDLKKQTGNLKGEDSKKETVNEKNM